MDVQMLADDLAATPAWGQNDSPALAVIVQVEPDGTTTNTLVTNGAMAGQAAAFTTAKAAAVTAVAA